MLEDNNRHETASVSLTDEDRDRSSSRRARDGICRSFGSISRRQFLGVTAGSVAFTGSVSAQESDEEQRAYKYWKEVADKNWGYGDEEGFEATQLYEYHEKFPERRGENINITIIDSGFDTDHPLFNPIDRGQRRREYHVNVVNRECFGTDCQGIGDNTARSFRERIFDAPKYHGTYVTGIVWQAAPNANYTIIRLGSNDDDPEIVRQNYLNAIEFAQQQTEYPPDVVNISGGLSRGRLSSDIVETIDRAYNEAADDMVIVAAAGTQEFPAPPSTAPNVISVSPLSYASDYNWYLHTTSAPEKIREGKPNIGAPGANISTIAHSNDFDHSDGFVDNPNSIVSQFGSSYAAPHVTGIAALLSDDEEPDEIRAAILNSTWPVLNDPRGLSGEGAVRILGAYNRLLRNNTLTVDVVNNITETPVAGATVTVNGEQKETSDGGEAYFDLEDGTYTVMITYEGFEDIEDEITIEGEDKRVLMAFDEQDEIDDAEEDEPDETEDEEEDDEPDDSEEDEEDEPDEPEDGEDTDPEGEDEEETAGELTVTIVGTNGPVSEGDTLEVTAEVKNTGDTELTQTIRLFIGTEGGLDFVAMDDETVTVAGGDSQTISLGYEVGAGPDADLIARVIGEDDSDETTIATSDMESPDSGGEEDNPLNVF